MTDPVSDMLTRIRNALIVKHSIALVPKSKINDEDQNRLHEIFLKDIGKLGNILNEQPPW